MQKQFKRMGDVSNSNKVILESDQKAPSEYSSSETSQSQLDSNGNIITQETVDQLDPHLKDELKEYMRMMKEASMNQVHTYDKDSFHVIEKQNNEIAIKYEDFPTDYISPPG